MQAADYDKLVASSMLEEVLLSRVREWARVYGWLAYHTHRSDRSEPGFPDLVLVHPRARRVLFVELKRERGKISAPQRVWLDALGAVADHVTALAGEPVLECHLWRPEQLLDGTIEDVLRVAPPRNHAPQ